jgi:hypothetical protein
MGRSDGSEVDLWKYSYRTEDYAYTAAHKEIPKSAFNYVSHPCDVHIPRSKLTTRPLA